MVNPGPDRPGQVTKAAPSSGSLEASEDSSEKESQDSYSTSCSDSCGSSRSSESACSLNLSKAHRSCCGSGSSSSSRAQSGSAEWLINYGQPAATTLPNLLCICDPWRFGPWVPKAARLKLANKYLQGEWLQLSCSDGACHCHAELAAACPSV